MPSHLYSDEIMARDARIKASTCFQNFETLQRSCIEYNVTNIHKEAMWMLKWLIFYYPDEIRVVLILKIEPRALETYEQLQFFRLYTVLYLQFFILYTKCIETILKEKCEHAVIFKRKTQVAYCSWLPYLNKQVNFEIWQIWRLERCFSHLYLITE